MPIPLKSIFAVIFTSTILSSIAVHSNAGSINGIYTSGDLTKYVSYANSGKFKYVGAVLINGVSCTGVLIQPNIVLTSAHCLLNKDTVFGQFRLNNSSLKANIAGAVKHIYWDLSGKFISSNNTINSGSLAAEDDIAVLLLDKELKPTPTIISIFSNLVLAIPIDEQIKFATAGFGRRGDGGSGPTNPYNATSMLGGENNARVSSKYGSYAQSIFYDMDRINDGVTSNSRNSDGLPGLPLEYLPAGGDSGSPLYEGPFLFGLHSRRQEVTPFGLNVFQAGRYGNIGFATPLAIHEDWISNVVLGLRKTKPIGIEKQSTPEGMTKFQVYQSQIDFADADPDITVIDDSEIPFEYIVTADTFDKVASPETRFSAFSSEFALNVSNGQPGTNVILNGSRFTGATLVTFNGVSAKFTVDSDTQISTIVPTGASTGLIKVVTPLGTSTSAINFTPTSLKTPTLTDFNPISGSVGTTVRIIGSGLEGVSSVIFYNGKISSFISTNQDGTEITVTVPDGAVSGKFQLLYPNGRLVSPSKFIVTP